MGDILKKNYGEQVNIRYIDVIDDCMDEFGEVEDYLKRSGMRLPLLTVNGKIIRPGTGVSYFEIVEELEEMGLIKA
ncbi:MAG: hypothetical protein ACYC21_03270 [Eubacteriales bacterium]